MKKFIVLFIVLAGFYGSVSIASAECIGGSINACSSAADTVFNTCLADNPNDTASCFSGRETDMEMCRTDCQTTTSQASSGGSGATTVSWMCPHASSSDPLDACLDAVDDVFANCSSTGGTNCTATRDTGYANCRVVCSPIPTSPSQTTTTGFPLTVTGSGASSTGTNTPVTLTNPLGTTDIRLLIARLIKAVLSIIGVIALLMFVYGGFLWMISAGREKQVEQGKDILKWTTLGIILIVSAYMIVNALFNAAFTGAL